MRSFWNRLPKPFFCLAPMADVTDPAFRKLIAEIAKPHVMWTEFVSADGLYHTREPQKDTAPIYGCSVLLWLTRVVETVCGNELRPHDVGLRDFRDEFPKSRVSHVRHRRQAEKRLRQAIPK